jgi:hypothetical protein
MTIVICLLHIFVPRAAVFAVELETPAAVLATVVFAVLLYCLYSHQIRVGSLFPADAASTRHS